MTDWLLLASGGFAVSWESICALDEQDREEAMKTAIEIRAAQRKKQGG